MSMFGNNPYLSAQMNAQAPSYPPVTQSTMQGGLLGVLNQLQASQNQANQANQTRYQDILGMYSNMGQAGEQQIAQNTAQQQALGTQSDMQRGLGNTTIMDATSRGVNQAGQQSLLNLKDTLSGQMAGAMERATQQGPDMSMYMNLLRGAASQPSGGSITGQPGMGLTMPNGRSAF